jgi:prevent-host-death family protein
MSRINPAEDIRSLDDLKLHKHDILNQIHTTGRPVILTVNGSPDSVLIDFKVYEKHLQAANLAHLLSTAEEDIKLGNIRPVRKFIKDFRRERDI